MMSSNPSDPHYRGCTGQRGADLRRWLLGYIEQAFRHVHLDGGMTIYTGESRDRYGDSGEDHKSLQAERIDWRRIPPFDLHERHCALAYLDAAGLRFYTPAIMSTIVRGEDERGLLTDSFLWALHDFRKNCEILERPYRFIYNRSQRAAIIRFVKFMIYNVPYGRCDDALKKTLDGLRRCANAGNTG